MLKKFFIFLLFVFYRSRRFGIVRLIRLYWGSQNNCRMCFLDYILYAKKMQHFLWLKKSKKFKSLNNKAKIYVSKIFKESSGIKGCKKCGEKIKLTFCINFSLIIKATSLFRIQFSDNDRFYSNSIQLTPDKVKLK